MGELLGLAIACGFGSADFLGGLAARRSPVVATVLLQQLSGLGLALVVVLVVASRGPSAGDVVLSMAAGVGGMVGLACLYRGLARGRMSVVAPLSAAGSAVLEVAWGLGRGERPGLGVLGGGALLVAAVVLVAGGPGEERSGRASRLELTLAAGAAVGFALSFVCFAETGRHSGSWPVLIARCTSVPLLVGLLLVTRGPLLPDRRDRPAAVGAGWLDAGANCVLLVAVRHDLLSLVAPLAALYPAATVLLARIVLREPVSRRRGIGLVLALAGLAVIAGR